MNECLGNRCPSKVIKSHNFDAIRKKDIGKDPAPSTVSPPVHKRTVNWKLVTLYGITEKIFTAQQTNKSNSARSACCLLPAIEWDWSLSLGTLLHSVLWHCWLGHLTHKTVPEMTYNVFSGTLNPTHSTHSCNRRSVVSRNTRKVIYSIQCIRRRAITYLVVATPTHRPFCLLQRRVLGSRLAWLPARGVAKWHSVDRRCTWYGCVGCSEVAYRRNICEFEWSFRSRWRPIIKRQTNSAYRRVVLRVACV